jgi:D-alanine-D-alanine ligase
MIGLMDTASRRASKGTGACAMRVGLTYDLKEYYLAHGMSKEDAAEFDSPDTIEGIESSLKNLGFETDRIGNIFELTQRLVAGDRWDMVFNIAKG